MPSMVQKFYFPEDDHYSLPTKDRVAVAFSKFDKDSDGYLTWEEFQEVILTFQAFYEL